MKVTILTTGKCKDKHVLAITNEYLKRVQPFIKTTLIEVTALDAAGEREAQLAKLSEQAFVIGLDERGENISTMALAEKFQKLQNQATQEVIFIIGGADGLSPEVKQRANMLLSFGKMTLPHMLVRPVIAEQVYRIGTVLAGHPYHREG